MRVPPLCAGLVLVAVACSGSTDTAPTITGAPVTPGGEVAPPPPVTGPSASGNTGDCAAWPFTLDVRTATGETRTVTSPAAFALQFNNGANWLIVTGDAAFDPSTLAVTLPEPDGKTLVTMNLTANAGGVDPAPLKAGDVFTPPDPRTGPQSLVRSADVDVRAHKRDTGPLGGLTGKVTVDAVSPGQLCVSFDLSRPAGAQARGRVTARILVAESGVFKP